MKFKSEKELLEFTSNIVGKTFKEIDSEDLLKNTNLTKQKGLLGHVVETGFYKYPINSDSRADFEELDIELKVTGYVKNKNGSLRAKERLVLSKIDYNKIINETFENSHVLGKCKKMLIIWYEYDQSKEAKDFVITYCQLYDMTKDFKVFSNDFEIIKGKVLEGKAHELSEGDTSYLGACTKARTSADRTTQPFSDILPKPRAYSLKNAYMTGILREYIETPLMTFDKFNTVEEYVKDKLKPYFGKTQLEILKEISGKEYVGTIPKHINKMISDEIIGKDDELPEKNELFRKTSYYIKNIPLNKKDEAHERLSFRKLRLDEFDVNWEDSEWKQFFEENSFILICYKLENNEKNGFRKLHSVKQISFSGEEIDSFKKTFDQIKLAIKNKNATLLTTSTNGFKDYELQLAPKAGKNANAYNTFFEKNVTDTCFMVNKKLINKKLKK